MDDMEQYRELFMAEAEEHLQALNQNLVELENNPNDLGIVNLIFRSAHTLKGSARTLGFDHISSLTHHMEDILDYIRSGKIPVTSEIMDMLFKCLDALETMVGKIGDGEDTTIDDVSDIVEEIKNLKEKYLSGNFDRKEPSNESNDPEESQEEDGMEKDEAPANTEKKVKITLKEPQTTIKVSKPKATEEVEKPENFDEIVKQIQKSAEALHVIVEALGYKELSETLKKIEKLSSSVLDQSISSNNLVIETLKESLTAMERIAKSFEENGNSIDIDLSQLSDKIDLAMAQEPTSEDVDEYEITLDHSIFNLDESAEEIKEMVVDQNYKLYHVKAKTSEDCALKSVRLAMVLSKIKEIGKLLESIPSEEELKEKSYEELDAIFLSSKELDDVKKVLDTVYEMDYIIVVPIEVDFEIEETTKSESEDKKPENNETKENEVVKPEKTESIGLNEDEVYKIKIIIDEECPLKSVRAYMVIKELKNIGKVIKTEPSNEVIEAGNLETNEVTIYLNSDKEIDDIKETIFKIPEIKDIIINPPKDSKIINKRESDNNSNTKKPQQAENKKTSPATQTVRVNIEKLDKLMNLVGELVINRANFTQIANKYDLKELHNAVNRLNMLATELQEEVMAMRMIPVAFVFNRFPRTVRDTARALKKEVDFIIEGSEIELDRTMLDELAEPLTHIIRNSLDHGIEYPDVREKLGKPRKGTLKLTATRERDHVNIIIEDDGKGIDPDVIRKSAVRKGILTEEEAEKLSDDEAINLIFLPGFSTAEKISDVSGRGVGMDVVKSKIESLGGGVSIQSEKGKGTKITLHLPLTMAIILALLVKLHDQIYAIPLTSVLDVASIQKDEIKNLEGQEAIIYRDHILPVFWLKDILNQYSSSDFEELYVVVVEGNKGKVGVIVDEVIDRDEIVVKPLTGILKNVNGLAGATILGDGRVALILDLSNI